MGSGEFWFNQDDNLADIEDALQKVIYTQGDTNTHVALKFAREYAYLPATIAEADLLKQQGKTIMAVGIGQNADKVELEAIATDASHVFIADNTDALKELHKEITVRTCKSIFELNSNTTPAN